jgi:hypothetical protein
MYNITYTLKRWNVSQDFESVLSLFCQYPINTWHTDYKIPLFLELGRDDRTICSSEVSHISFPSCV